MAKLTETQLYETWLDIKYANEVNDDFIYDLDMEIKIARKHRTKIKKMLKAAAEHYESIYGRVPLEMKGK